MEKNVSRLGEADEKIKNHIAELNTQNNYWGWLFSTIRRREAKIPSIMTLSPEKDGKLTLLYDKDLVMSTTSDNLYQVVKHEGMHVLKDHIPRLMRLLCQTESKKKEISSIYNIAADIVANRDGRIHSELIIGGDKWETLTAEMFKLPEGLITEDYYQRLLKQKNNGHKQKSKASGKGKEVESPGKETGSEGDETVGFDDHSSWLKAAEETADVKNLARKIEHTTRRMVVDSVKKFNRVKGRHLPQEIQEMIDELLKPAKIPYYYLISKLVKGSRKAKRIPSSTRANRKRLYLSMATNILPYPGKTYDQSFNIVIVLDTSGSQSKEDIMEGLSSCKNIIEKDRDCKVTVIEIDTVIRNEYTIEKLRDIQMSIRGRGGTRLYDGLARAKELRPDCTLVFTDGYTENINDINKKELPSKIIWVVQKDEKGGIISRINRFPHIVRV